MIETDNSAVFAHRISWQGNTTVALHNLSDRPCQVQLAANGEGSDQLIDLFGNKVYEATIGNAESIPLDSYGYRWFRLDGLRR